MYAIGTSPDRILVQGPTLIATESEAGWQLAGGSAFRVGEQVVFNKEYYGTVFRVTEIRPEVFNQVTSHGRSHVMVTSYQVTAPGMRPLYAREDQLQKYQPASRSERTAAEALLLLSKSNF